MGKKVPDWLNSRVWYADPSRVDDRRSSSRLVSEYSLEPPEPTPPPVERIVEKPSPSETRENLNSQKDVSTPSTPVGGDEFEDERLSISAPCEDDIARQTQILTELSRKVINIRELRKVASQGIPETSGVRSTVWKILLGYLPPDRSLWPSELAKRRSQYKHLKEELLMSPSEITRKLEKSSSKVSEETNGKIFGFLSRSEVKHEEHPLSLGDTSIWNQFFQDMEIMEQIDRDVKRTHPGIHFFSGGSSLAKSNQAALKSILVIFSKLNPGLRYVQGMNELIAPIFYVLRNDLDDEMAAYAEPDAFFCFVELISGIRDNFCQQLDNSVVGIRSTITRLSQLLKKHDEELWRHLEVTTRVNPQFYAFRWITLLLTQEFAFSRILTIWDALLSDPEGIQEALLRICCAMLLLVRKRLLAGDFTSNLKLLQNYPSPNVKHLLYVANKLRAPPGTA